MAALPPSPFLLLFLLFSIASPCASASPSDGRSAYIVHVAHSAKPSVFYSHRDWYAATLASVRGGGAAAQGLLYSYHHVFHGFAAEMSEEEAAAMAEKDGVLSLSRDEASAQLHTTRTPRFLGLDQAQGLLPDSGYGEDVIVGVMDSGIWPESRSFRDDGEGSKALGRVPARWKGECESTPDFPATLCNRKLIGARAFYKGYETAVGAINSSSEFRSPRDSEGHGTHTSSTAAGAIVADASLMGAAPGTARGMADRARIAAYKVCWSGGCFNSDLLAAFDSAVADGVDIISLSVGGGFLPYFLDPIAIGSFGAMEHGILVSASAGNAGPSPGSVANVAPWLLTVGASTLDRDFPARVLLPNGETFKGVSLYNGDNLPIQSPLIYAGDASASGNNGSANLCIANTLDPERVRGKIVLCDRGVSARASKGMVVKKAGGIGMILANADVNGEELIADSHVLPATLVGYKAGSAIKNYIKRAGPNPTAGINFTGTVLGVRPAPVMAAFSSRGPNPANPEILKPDLTAPGINILAAWTSKIGPTELAGDERRVDFNIMSGTSMSCPHASGLAALLKGAHPNWSPAAIKSALMTTAYDVDNTGNILSDGADSSSATPFAYGAGHVNPSKALDPGLVYDLSAQDYVDFLCGQNYSETMLLTFTKGRYKCSSGAGSTPGGVNYPSFAFVYNSLEKPSYAAKAGRTVTNVAGEGAVYKVKVEAPEGVTMRVEPGVLEFSGKATMERKSYEVSVVASNRKELGPGESTTAFGSVTWTDDKGHYVVRSPVAFTWQN